MANEVRLSTFPSNKVEALAYLYVQSKDLSGKTPGELAAIYETAYYDINDKFRELMAERRRIRNG